MTSASIIIFDGFSDLDLFIPMDILSRIKTKDWKTHIVGTAPAHRSRMGASVSTTATLDSVSRSDVVLIVGGRGSRACVASPDFMAALSLDPGRQVIGSQCSGALILAEAGLLRSCSATTTYSAKEELRSAGVEVVDRPFVSNGNLATAGGCLASMYLATWAMHRTIGVDEARHALREVTPEGASESFIADIERTIEAGDVTRSPPRRAM